MKEHPLTSVAKNRGGVHVAYHKNTRYMTAQRMPVPAEVVLPMQQSIGAPCTPLVQKGDTVKVGQKIGDSDAFVSVPIHASVSGTVNAVGPVRLAGGSVCQGVTIASVGNMELFEELHAPAVTNLEELLSAVRESGVVGLGGAGFPTHVKLRVPPEKHIDTLIVNAAECEPYITVDNREAIDNSWDVLSGVYTLKEIMRIPHVVIAVEDNKPQAIEALEKIAGRDNTVDVMRLKSIYPQGAEKMLVYSVTGRRVPDGGLPADVGCIVINIATVAFIARYLKTGKPLVSRSITVDGTAIRNPLNLRVPIGTRLADIIDYCGGFTKEPEKIIFGGPMMGVAIYNLNAPICKQNNALLAFEKADYKTEHACIRCGRCAAACPMSLAPTLLKTLVSAQDTEEMKRRGIMSCMECGCCAFSCPSGIPLVQYMKLGKQLLREAKK
ncbi:MAG: electron transport complex subunit RsxC [Clostridia bacterium]|nr:electron transport complex subunit RsxC [Clostridia bacterium]